MRERICLNIKENVSKFGFRPIRWKKIKAKTVNSASPSKLIFLTKCRKKLKRWFWEF